MRGRDKILTVFHPEFVIILKLLMWQFSQWVDVVVYAGVQAHLSHTLLQQNAAQLAQILHILARSVQDPWRDRSHAPHTFIRLFTCHTHTQTTTFLIIVRMLKINRLTGLQGKTAPETAGPVNCAIIIQCLYITALTSPRTNFATAATNFHFIVLQA